MMKLRWNHRLGGERGSEAIEAVIGVPALVLFVMLVVAGGRVAVAQQAVQSAAADAARSASIARTPGQAQSQAVAAAKATLLNQKLPCADVRVAVNTAGFSAPVGTPATASSTVSCRVNLGDLSIPGVPGSTTLTATMSSPIDTYRER